jgi:hypothetical protein
VTPPEVWVKVTGQIVVEEWTTTVVMAVDGASLGAVTEIPIAELVDEAGAPGAVPTDVAWFVV